MPILVNYLIHVLPFLSWNLKNITCAHDIVTSAWYHVSMQVTKQPANENVFLYTEPHNTLSHDFIIANVNNPDQTRKRS